MSNATSDNDNHVESKEQSIDEPKNLEESVNDEDWETGSEDEEESLPEGYEGPYKMVFVVNTELKMGVGKIAAQVGHATLGLYQMMTDEENPDSNIIDQIGFWEDFDGGKKIALKGLNTEHLLDLEKKAKEKGLYAYLVHDAGHTQVAAGSLTVLSVFGRDCIVQDVTGKLKLL